MDKNAWMASVERDAAERAHDKRVRRERAQTLKTRAAKAFRRGDYSGALSCYNKALEQIKDDPTVYCDRALTNVKLKDYQKVFPDCETALRLNEKSYKARIYKAKAHKELEEIDKYEESRKELEEIFPQHKELTDYFLNKKEESEEEN
ncbi:Tetratricopeptide repeat protein 12 [Eumeta japonica]|uniref:Tetratricopeptide repeat protein 12 n=1 Tax=Eumeta variegata TaxID=151549 RepID=A0A4C1VLD6_EUMVA|nr:Tetratricopeptide repeat protein 12 [Eumeta japonica]